MNSPPILDPVTSHLVVERHHNANAHTLNGYLQKPLSAFRFLIEYPLVLVGFLLHSTTVSIAIAHELSGRQHKWICAAQLCTASPYLWHIVPLHHHIWHPSHMAYPIPAHPPACHCPHTSVPCRMRGPLILATSYRIPPVQLIIPPLKIVPLISCSSTGTEPVHLVPSNTLPCFNRSCCV